MALHKLNQKKIDQLSKPGAKPGRHGDGGGLLVQVKESGASWSFAMCEVAARSQTARITMRTAYNWSTR
jgi:hypothetical protein